MDYSPSSRLTEYNVTEGGTIEVVVPSVDYYRIKESVNRTSEGSFKLILKPENRTEIREGSRLAFIMTDSGQWKKSCLGRTKEYSVIKVTRPEGEPNALIAHFRTREQNEARSKSKKNLRKKGVPVVYQTERDTSN